MTETAWVFYRGGPKDRQILAGHHDSGMLIAFDRVGEVTKDNPRFAYYKLTDETHATAEGAIPIAQYIGDQPPAQQPGRP